MSPFSIRNWPALTLALLCAVPGGGLLAQSSSGERFFAALAGQFARLDADGDRQLSVNEVNVAVGDATLNGSEAAAVAALKRSFRSKSYGLPPLTLDALRVLATNTPATNRPNYGRMFAEGMRKLTNATSAELFASGAPRLETIRQGKMGNCFTLAPLGALVHREPEQLLRMIEPFPDGRYRVRFGARTVIVPRPTAVEQAIMASNDGDGVWVNLYEKAVGQARAEAKSPEQRRGTALDEIAGGGSAGTMLGFITGHNIERFSFKFAKDERLAPQARAARLAELRARLSRAVRARHLMTVGTLKPTTPGIRGNHAYAALHYDAATDQVRVWDPHGDNFKPKGEPGTRHGYPRRNGQYELPLEEFVKQFSGMAFEVPPAKAEDRNPRTEGNPKSEA